MERDAEQDDRNLIVNPIRKFGFLFVNPVASKPMIPLVFLLHFFYFLFRGYSNGKIMPSYELVKVTLLAVI
jgi:hypothetical protein